MSTAGDPIDRARQLAEAAEAAAMGGDVASATEMLRDANRALNDAKADMRRRLIGSDPTRAAAFAAQDERRRSKQARRRARRKAAGD